VTSVWKGLGLIIEDILDQFNIDKGSWIEFGVHQNLLCVDFLEEGEGFYK
jgi:hypothetical protein